MQAQRPAHGTDQQPQPPVGDPRYWRPSGLGTSAALLPNLLAAAREITPARLESALAAEPADDPAYTERAWGDGSGSPLYCPRAERINDVLGAEVDRRLADWAEECGFEPDQLAQLGRAGFGRLAMLTHTDAEDPDALLVAAQLNASWWAADDYYADDTEMGAEPSLLPPRLVLAMAAMDPVPPVGDFTAPLQETLEDDLVLRMLRSAVEHLNRHGTPAQVQRACYATFAMFVSWTAYAAWRETGAHPPAWKYLAARQHDSFYTSMTLIDPVGGYELPANLFYEHRIREAVTQAGTASVIVNDLVSVAKDAADPKPVCNLVLLIAADRGCSVPEAAEVAVVLHNDLVRAFQATHRALTSVPSPELQRFLRGVRAWMGGGVEWHVTNPRYTQPNTTQDERATS